MSCCDLKRLPSAHNFINKDTRGLALSTLHHVTNYFVLPINPTINKPANRDCHHIAFIAYTRLNLMPSLENTVYDILQKLFPFRLTLHKGMSTYHVWLFPQLVHSWNTEVIVKFSFFSYTSLHNRVEYHVFASSIVLSLASRQVVCLFDWADQYLLFIA